MFTVYSKPACPACDQAKALILSKGLSYEEIILDVGQPKHPEKMYISREELLAKFPTARTVPQIEAENAYVGGINELRQSLEVATA